MSQAVINRVKALERRWEELFSDTPQDDRIDALERRIATLEARVAEIEAGYQRKRGRKPNGVECAD